ncbi:MAG: type II toxin-antitoxin system VapC family toxin [Nitrococcus mobilis]|nr:type II toxin-antitoxin system VapC family toxin [Nitrococcus mobilis]
MKIVDLNVLLYAVNENAPQHKSLLSWWERAVNGDEAIGLPWVVLLGFLRIATNPKIFPHPLDPAAALAKIHTWLSLANTSVVREKDEHWDILRTILGETGTAGNLTTDAHLATLAVSHGAILASCDRDFARFRGLRWENPIDAH